MSLIGSVSVQTLPLAERAALLEPLAALRCEVFAEYPYLYAGDLDYERAYLAPILERKEACLVAAFDGGALVGAATGVALLGHDAAFATALEGCGVPLEQIYYCAESVLRPAYRGQGVGHRFFDLREATARTFGFTHVAFCAVVREGPAPDGYRSLEGFWRKRGYAAVPGAVARYAWRDVGAAGETEKPLQFWGRKL